MLNEPVWGNVNIGLEVGSYFWKSEQAYIKWSLVQSVVSNNCLTCVLKFVLGWALCLESSFGSKDSIDLFYQALLLLNKL